MAPSPTLSTGEGLRRCLWGLTSRMLLGPLISPVSSVLPVQWARQAGGSSPERDSARGIGVDSGGHVYVAGGIFDAFQHEEFFLARYDNAGALEWVQPSDAGTSGYDLYGTGLAVDSAGNSF